MNADHDTFDWVDLPQGRARFSGIQRCWDERGRVTFCVEVAGTSLYGEIDQAFHGDGDHYDLEVVSFGHDWARVAMPDAAGQSA